MIDIVKFDVQKYLPYVAGLYDGVFTRWPWFDKPLGQKKAEKYILGELAKSMSVAYLAIANETPVGFAWGYRCSASGFAYLNSKYKTKVGQDFIFRTVPKALYFYISEVGVDPKFQSQKIGRNLTLQLAQEPGPLLMRTKIDSWMLPIALKQIGMTPIISPDLDVKDPEDSERVVLVKYD